MTDKKEDLLDDVVSYFEDGHGYGFLEPPSSDTVREEFFDIEFFDRHDVIDDKWVKEPFAHVSVLYDEENEIRRYRVTEPVLDEFERYVRRDLESVIRTYLRGRKIDKEKEKSEVFETVFEEVVENHGEKVGAGTLQKLGYYFERDFVGYGPIDPLMHDTEIEDISCNGHDTPVFIYHRSYGDIRTNISFSEDELNSLAVRLAQRGDRHISVANPMVSTTLPDGSRAQLTLGSDIGMRGSNFTIRKFFDEPYTPIDLIRFGTFSVREMAFLWLAIQNKMSIIFAGPTASGKTTSMNAVSFFLPPDTKVVSIEDVPEVSIPHENWVSEVTRESGGIGERDEITMYDLLQAALHKRPEYLLVGEIRTKPEVVRTFFQSVFTGHPGATTFHAESVEAAMNRFTSEPLSVPERMIDAVDLVSVQDQVMMGDERVRRNRNITEVFIPEESDSIETNHLFRWDPGTDSFENQPDMSGSSEVLRKLSEDRGWSEEKIIKELSDREMVLSYLVQNEVNDYRDVTAVLHAFARTPERITEKIRDGSLEPERLRAENLNI